MVRPIFAILLLTIYFLSCTATRYSEIKNTTLFKIDDKGVTAKEFIYVYEKNNFNNQDSYSEDDINEYLDMFINFKLKVADARSLKYDTMSSFINEFNSYRSQLIKPYLSESKQEEKVLQEAYEHMKYEVDASHILIKLDENAGPEDTLKAYNTILDIAEKAKNGEDFEMLALESSQDPSAKVNKGHLGYFKAFQMVYPFEAAAFNTPAGNISPIIRTRFGYHILKVHDKRPASGKVKISHIMVREGANQIDSVAARNKIFEIYDQLSSGEDWNDLCLRYSDDLRTKSQGGTLPFLEINQINDKTFENMAFGLNEPGEISDPFRSRFGWHILKLEEKKGLEPFDEIREELSQKVHRDGRLLIEQKNIISKLKNEYRFNENDKTLSGLKNLADSTLLAGKWDTEIASAQKKDTLFSLKNASFQVDGFLDFIDTHQRKRYGLTIESYFNELYNNYTERILLKAEEENLLEHNDELGLLLNEYYEGILLFEIMDKNVWKKAVEDSAGLYSFFEANKDNYMWNERADVAIISSKDSALIQTIKEDLYKDDYLLYQARIDTSLAGKNINKIPALDSIADLYEIYKPASVHIVKYDTGMNDIIDKVLDYFYRQGLEKDRIRIEYSKENKHFADISLNSTAKKSLELLYNKESTLTLQVLEGLFEKGENERLDKIKWSEGDTTFSDGKTSYLIYIKKIVAPENKTFEETKGLIISDYQNQLEKDWIQELKKKFTVEKDDTVFKKVKHYIKTKHTSGN